MWWEWIILVIRGIFQTSCNFCELIQDLNNKALLWVSALAMGIGEILFKTGDLQGKVLLEVSAWTLWAFSGLFLLCGHWGLCKWEGFSYELCCWKTLEHNPWTSSRDQVPPRIYLSPGLSGTSLGFRSFSPFCCIICVIVKQLWMFINHKEGSSLKER